MGADFGVIREGTVREVRPAGRLADQVYLGVALGLAHLWHPLDARRFDLTEVTQGRPHVAHHTRGAVCVRGDAFDPHPGQHLVDRLDGVAAGVVEVAVDGVDTRIGRDALGFQPRDRDLDTVVRHREGDRPLGLDVVEPGDVLDTRRVEPHRGVGIGPGQTIADCCESGLEFAGG